MKKPLIFWPVTVVRPETTFYKAQCVEVIDPFGNCIQVNEDVKADKAT